jgi:uncharacterized protein
LLSARHLRCCLALLCCLACRPLAADKIADIHPDNYVTDRSGVISGTARDQLNALCAEVEHKTGAQIAVVTVRSLDGQPIENYAVDLFKHLGVGRKDNRGILLLVAPNDRRYRFEVGYGLEPVINDARAGDVGREMVPLLRQNNYSGAVQLAVGRVANLIASASNVKLENVAPEPATAQERGGKFPFWIVPIGLLVVIFIIRAIGGGGGGPDIHRRRHSGLWWMGPWIGGGGGGGWGSGSSWGGGGFGGSSGGFGGFGGGSSGGGGASGSW